MAGTDSILNAEDNLRWLRQHAGEVPRIDWSDPEPVRPDQLGTLAERARALAGRYDSGSRTATAPSDDAKMLAAARSLRGFAGRLASADTDAERERIASRLSAWQAAFVAHLRDLMSKFRPGDLRIDQLPPELRSHLVSADGTYALYINPREDLWDRAALARFVADVEGRLAKEPGVPPATGIAVNILHSTEAIHAAFLKATLYALGLIFVLVLIDLRKLGQTLLAVSVLALGLPMLVAVMGLAGVSWNFANFFGLPILIGAGHEYGVFMVHRYREARRDPRRPWKGWDASDAALLGCAYVTSTSFGFFWLFARHQGLKSLGLVMAVGTACIYLATLSVLRPVLKWRLAAWERVASAPKRRSG